MEHNTRNLPTNPGVYIMRDENDTVIYVGKAKNLKSRVSQYFQSGKHHTSKVSAMVSSVGRYEYIVTDTEFEALVLECNLIKKYMPKYNVLLKDDKTYPYIKVTILDKYPRILLARRQENDGAMYFGPYLNAGIVKNTIDLIRKIFGVHSCKKIFPRDIGKERPCLNYQIGKCIAPCTGNVSEEEYKKTFEKVIKFLNGEHKEIIDELYEKMKIASEKLEFEKAAKLRDKINAINKIDENQKITSSNQTNYDAVVFVKNDKNICAQVFFVRNGKISGRESYVTKNEEQKLSDFIKQYYGMTPYIPPLIVTKEEVEDSELLSKWLSEKCGANIRLKSLKSGEKHEILKMAEKNAYEALLAYELKKDIKQQRTQKIMLEFKKMTGMLKEPYRIEAYDISNISGTYSVGVCVVFENGVPKKSEYRKFNIQSVEGSNDYESMREVIYRRISNGVEKEKGFENLPDVILLDGGKGHVSSIKPILEFFNADISLFGMVKDEHHKTRGLVTENEEIAIKRTSEIFKFLTAVQDEVHRFAIKTHKTKRNKNLTKSVLDNIEGVGVKRKTLLLKKFKTIKAIKEATMDELIQSGIDKKTAEKITEYFKSN